MNYNSSNTVSESDQAVICGVTMKILTADVETWDYNSAGYQYTSNIVAHMLYTANLFLIIYFYKKKMGGRKCNLGGTVKTPLQNNCTKWMYNSALS